MLPGVCHSSLVPDLCPLEWPGGADRAPSTARAPFRLIACLPSDTMRPRRRLAWALPAIGTKPSRECRPGPGMEGWHAATPTLAPVPLAHPTQLGRGGAGSGVGGHQPLSRLLLPTVSG